MTKTAFVFAAAVVLMVSFSTTAFAACEDGSSSWIAAWTDQFGQTTYSVTAPCRVFTGSTFEITATVSDGGYPMTDVGFAWAIKDNGVVLDGGGFNWIATDVNGEWSRTVSQMYVDPLPAAHIIEFTFTDLGQGSGAHFWGTSLLGGITVDPLPPTSNTPPTVEAGENIVLASGDQNGTVIAGTASDADGDALIYRWLEDGAELQPFRLVESSGNAPFDLGTLPPLSLGSHTFTLEVSDGSVSVSDTVVVSVENSAPIATPSAGGTFQIGEAITLTGQVADYDGDTLSYRWLEGTAVLAVGAISTPVGGAPIALPEWTLTDGLPLGSHVLTLEVGDGVQTVAATSTMTVVDTAAPSLAPVASSTILWPPDGSMTEVAITANAHDNSGEAVALVVRVTSNQAADVDRDGNVIPDYTIVSIDPSTGMILLQLRAARAGNGESRIYFIDITAADASGNSSTATMQVKAPHDMGRADVSR